MTKPIKVFTAKDVTEILELRKHVKFTLAQLFEMIADGMSYGDVFSLEADLQLETL